MFSEFLFSNVIKQSRASCSHFRSYVIPDLKCFLSQSALSCGCRKGTTELSSNSVHHHRLLHSVLPKSKRLLNSKGSVGTVLFDTSNFSGHHFLHTACLKHALTDGKNQCQIKYSTAVDDKSGKDTSSLLETWFYEVSPYGSLVAHLPFKTVIQPLNPIDYPDMNKCIVELRYNTEASIGGNLPNSHQLAQISNMYNLNVSFDKDKANMTLNCDVIEGVNVPVFFHVRVPLKFDLSLKISGNENVAVENMESNSISIEAEKGDVTLKKIKNILADKLQGSSMTCITEMGSIDVKSLYSEGATFKTVSGDIRLGQGHGQICVVGERSNLQIESLDGDLDVGIQLGSVNAHLSRHNKVDLDIVKGDIGLSFPEGANTDLLLSGPSVSMEENMGVQFNDTDLSQCKEGHIGEKGVARVNARTLSGNIHLSVMDWIQTTKLLFMDRKTTD